MSVIPQLKKYIGYDTTLLIISGILTEVVPICSTAFMSVAI